jgi:hypothetical protein
MIRQTLALLLSVALASSGCATARYSHASARSRQPPAPADASVALVDFVQKLPAGARVRVETSAGRTLRGTLLKATADEIVVQRNTRIPVGPETLSVSQVVRVTVEQSSSSGKLVATGAAIGAGAAIGVVWMIALLVFGD